MTPPTEEVLDEVNQQWRRSWQLIRPLGGGQQSGAFAVHDASGMAVLKWWARPGWAPRVLAARALVDEVRGCGYPTPAWLAVGTTSAGFPYEVQEFVDGTAMGPLDDDGARAIVDLIQLQRRIHLPTSVDWTDYMCRTVFDDDDGSQRRLIAGGDAVRSAVAGAVDLAARYRGAHLAHGELVHGDFSSGNLLMRDGRIVGVVDIEALGTGGAGFDLLAPARQAYLWRGDRRVAGRLLEVALSSDGPAFVALAVATHVINILAFGLDHWEASLDEAATRCVAWMNDVASAL